MKTRARTPRRRSRSRRAYHHGALRAALIEAAAQLATERGAASVSLRAVARRAGVSEAAPYHYFSDKGALLKAVADEGFQALDEALAAAGQLAGGDAVDHLAALAAAYVRFALDRPELFRLIFDRPAVDRDSSRSRPERLAALDDRLLEAVRAARAAFGHDDLDPASASTLIQAVPHGLARLYLDAPPSADLTPRSLELLARAAVRQLAAAPLDEPGLAPAPWAV